MGQENLETDLFGNPVRRPKEGPGRPEIVWNKETSDRVLLGFLRGWTVKRVADLVGMSVPTLRKEYFSELAQRRGIQDRFEILQMVRLNRQAEAGNVTAERELARRLDVLRMRDASAKFGDEPKKSKPTPKGIKAEREERAWLAGKGDEDWGDLLHGETGAALPN